MPVGGADVYPIHAATGHAYGTGFAGVSHRHAPDAWLPAVRYLFGLETEDVARRVFILGGGRIARRVARKLSEK